MAEMPKVREEEFQVLIEAVRSLARSVQVVNQFGVQTEGAHHKEGELSWQRAIELLDQLTEQLTEQEDGPAESSA